jgi:DNA topoisomerase-1
MSNSTIETTIIRLQNNDNKFYTYNTKLLFDGYKKIYKAFENNENEKIIPLSILKLGSAIKATDVEIKEKVTQPPPRYTQASLIKELDESGVGRPSTYKMMADKVLERGYAILDARAYKITETGTDVIESLEGFFAEYIDKNFTKEMEEHLDSIAEEGEN